MKCRWCDFRTLSIDEEVANEELSEHQIEYHLDSMVRPDDVLYLLDLHTERNIPIIDLVDKFFDIRTRLSQGTVLREKKNAERFERERG